MSRSVGLGFALLCLLATPSDAAPGVLALEPAELITRRDLEGREVVVDDRVRLFQFHVGKGYDELYLKRTPVVFRLPPQLREVQAQNPQSVRVQGVMKREGDGWACDVTALEPQSEDLKRLNRAAASLPPRDFEGRLTWARWAERRGKDFHDGRLLARAVELEGDAIRIEAERPEADPVPHWLSLAERARARRVPEPEPSALAHRAFQTWYASAKTAEDVAPLLKRIAAFFPEASKNPGAVADFPRWREPYGKNPADAYRAAPPPVRAALDHNLWADATQRHFELQVAADPPSGLTLADQAETELPERPEVAKRLLELGLNAAAGDLGKLRLAEIESLAKVYRDRLHQPERARGLVRDWLDDQRKRRLRPTDAEGRLLLARQYETLLGDEPVAAELLREAWKIDPESKELTDAFLRRSYRKVGGDWVKPDKPKPSTTPSPAADDPPRGTPRGTLLRGSTPREVRERLGGKPDKVIRSVSQGQLVEQWVYVLGKQVQYINFLHTPGETQPRVIANYSLRLSDPQR